MSNKGFSISIESDKISEELVKLDNFECKTFLTGTINELARELKRETPQATGSLVNSIRQEVGERQATIGYTVDYAPHVEYGHRQTKGRYVPKLGKRLKASYVEGQHFFYKSTSRALTMLRKHIRDYMGGLGI